MHTIPNKLIYGVSSNEKKKNRREEYSPENQSLIKFPKKKEKRINNERNLVALLILKEFYLTAICIVCIEIVCSMCVLYQFFIANVFLQNVLLYIF